MIVTNAKDTNDQSLENCILRDLGHINETYNYAVPRGWKAIVEVVQDASAGEKQIKDFLLGAKSDDKADECALAKMTMLRTFPTLAMTGERDPQILNGQIARYAKDKAEDVQAELEEVRSELFKLQDTQQMSAATIKKLHKHNLTHYAGGIRIPYARLRRVDDDFREEHGEFRIVFSGAKEQQDLFFALHLLACIRRTMNNNMEVFGQTTLDLSELKKNSYAHMFIDFLGLKET